MLNNTLDKIYGSSLDVKILNLKGIIFFKEDRLQAILLSMQI